MIRKIRAGLVSLLLVTAAVFGLSLPAQAVPACGAYICLYDGTDGSTLLERSVASLYALNTCYPMGQYSNNKIGYSVNNTASYYAVYDTSNCTSAPGAAGPIYPNSYGAMNATWNNKISSIKRIS